LPRTKAKSKPKRQKKTYKHPIPSRNKLIDFLADAGKPLKIEVILSGFSLRGQRMRALLVDRLDGMVRAGQIIENRRHEYCLTEKLEDRTSHPDRKG
jgi:ribonuclease R